MAVRLANMALSNPKMAYLKDYVSVTDAWVYEYEYENPEHWNGKTAFVESALDKPLHWKSPRVIFVCSMSDLFHETVPCEWIDKIIDVAESTPEHKYLLLTKRPQKMKEYYEYRDGTGTITNIGIGVTVCTQAEADEKIPILLSIPAAMRFVSIEPMLEGFYLPEDANYCETCGLHFEPIDIEMTVTKHNGKEEIWTETFCRRCHDINPEMGSTVIGSHIGLDWVLLGGESGHKARPMHPDWARGVQKQCTDAGVPFLFKQWGKYHPHLGYVVDSDFLLLPDGEQINPNTVDVGIINRARRNGADCMTSKYDDKDDMHHLAGIAYHQFPKFFER
jgi:protein gp37